MGLGPSCSLSLTEAFALKPRVGSPLGAPSDSPGLEALDGSPAMMAMFTPSVMKMSGSTISVNRREEPKRGEETFPHSAACPPHLLTGA